MLEKKLLKEIKENQWWKKEEKILVGVSGGVDSMVLLDLLLNLPAEYRPKVHVAHINHQLREISDEEEAFVMQYCLNHQVPVFTTTWSEGKEITSNIEQAARDIRYLFFHEIMGKKGINKLVTAHHRNDQVETILMRLLNGNSLQSLTGIQQVRAFGNGKIIRPLLLQKKDWLYEYAIERDIPYYEDESNQDLTYMRNRLRTKIIPDLKAENSRVEEHLLWFRDDLHISLALVEEVVRPKYEACVCFLGSAFKIDVELFMSYSSKEQHFILNYLSEAFRKEKDVSLSRRQQQQIWQNLLSERPNFDYPLKEQWYFKKDYQQALIYLKNKPSEVKDSFNVSLNEGKYLSKEEWFGFFEVDKYCIPQEITSWDKHEMTFSELLSETITVRKRLPGDRLILNEKGQKKKISRYFIDEKIATAKRDSAWVVKDQEDIVKWLLPFRESYLSIRDETAKIQYKLVYYYKKDK